jgi:hypothetical protein
MVSGSIKAGGLKTRKGIFLLLALPRIFGQRTQVEPILHIGGGKPGRKKECSVCLSVCSVQRAQSEKRQVKYGPQVDKLLRNPTTPIAHQQKCSSSLQLRRFCPFFGRNSAWFDALSYSVITLHRLFYLLLVLAQLN